MNTSNNRFFVYARKSTDDTSRQIRSIDDQIAELSELAEREKLTVVDILIERQTAKRPGRPVFNEMLKRVEDGEANGILAWHPDRLSRNSVDAGRIIWFVDIGIIKDLRFPTFYFDPSPSGKLNLSNMLSQSKYYSDNLSENIKRGQRQKVRNGIWPKLAPLGYLNDKVTRAIAPDPVKAPLVAKAFELYATGTYTLKRLREKINELGLEGLHHRLLSVSNYQYILKNPIYYGVIRYKGELYPAKHEPIITKALFDKVQDAMTRKSKPKSRGMKPYLYRGMFRCAECGGFITMEIQKGHHYLRCTKKLGTCSQPYVREELISRQVADYLNRVALPEPMADAMIAELQAEQRDDAGSRQAAIDAVRDRIRTTDARLGRLMTAYVEDAISLDEYRREKNRLVDEKRNLEDQVVALEMKRASWLEPAIRFISEAKSAGFLASTGSEEKNRDFLRKVGSNLTISNRILTVTPRGAWQLVVDAGRFAQTNAAPLTGAAAFLGETDQTTTKRRGRDSNPGYGNDPV